MRRITESLLAPLSSELSGRLILDAGCGTGANLEFLARYSPDDGRVIGTDLSHTALEFCRERGHDQLVEASIDSLPFSGDLFDLVTCFDVLVQLHGENADLKALHELYRVLKPGGLLFARVAANRWMFGAHDRAINAARRYALDELNTRLASSGFTVLRSTYANTFLFPVAIVRRLILQPMGVVEDGSDVKPLPSGLSWLNPILTRTLELEAHLLKSGRFPVGLSAISIARKPH
jgi:ubiquinone/menaquinone biosynthesis C-methylase UbiE